MAETRTYSISGGGARQRQESISAQDVSHLARVDASVAEEAAKATQSEVSMTLLQGIKTYPNAIGWSILLSTCIIVSLAMVKMIAIRGAC